MPAVDKLEAYEALPLELRLLALGLPVQETPVRRAA
jgi:hypothetical protein